jgi:hypothetical protein
VGRTREEATGLLKSTIHRVWQAFGLPSIGRARASFPLIPSFWTRSDIVDRSLNPDKALVLWVDENSYVQALIARNPSSRWGWGMSKG